MGDKSDYKPPEAIALLPKESRPAAPYPPPYSQNDSSSKAPPQIGLVPPGAYNQLPGSYPAPSGPYPPLSVPYPPSGSYPQSSAPYPQSLGSYSQPSGPYPQPPGQYLPSQPGFGTPHVAHGPPQVPPQGGYSPGPMQGVYAQGAPITAQPTSWMAVPQNVPGNCPRGLEFLTMIDQLLVHQEVELLEIFTGFETENRYSILNSVGQRIYYAVEESGCCSRNCCGSRRALDIKIMDNYGSTIINLNRPLACQSCCYPCCLQSMEVCSPPGTVIGRIEQQWSLWFPKLLIKNSSGDTILQIEGPCCTMACCGDVEFKVMSNDGNKQVGKISKKWSGYTQEAFSDADNFGISFPMDLDVKMKAVVLGACFLIDMMYFESAPNQKKAH